MALNQYTQLLYYIKELAESDDFINTVTQGNLDEAFLNKRDVYPLLHIAIDAGSFTNGNTIIFDVILECVALRDINNEINTDKFWNQDNEVDNHNETLVVLNTLWSRMFKDFEDRNITASENPQLTKITGEKTNFVDGWRLEFEVELPNNELNLCM